MKLPKVPVIFEDKDILVINKPAGLVVHADGRTEEVTLVDWIMENYPKIKKVGEPITLSDGSVLERPGIVHRIDRDTSGVLIIAKTQKSFEDLKLKFQNREIEKTYRAFVYGAVKEDEGVIDRPIARSRSDFRLWSAQRGGKGTERDALTEYKVLGRRTDVSFLDLKPKTGRTHQIRVHMKAINHPVVCDSLYAPKREPLLGFQRLALHAYSVQFTSISGKLMKFDAPYPKDFKEALSNFNKGIGS